MRKLSLSIALSLTLASQAMAEPATQPATQPAAAAPQRQPAANAAAVPVKNIAVINGQPINFPDQRKQMKENQKKAVGNWPLKGKYKLSDIIRFSMKDGLLQADWTGAVMTATPVRIEIEGSSATWVVQQAQVIQHRNFPQGFTNINLSRYDFDRPDNEGPYVVSMSINNRTFGFNAMYGPGSDLYNVSYFQANNAVHLNWMDVQNGRPIGNNLNMSAPSLLQLRADHPDDARHAP